MPLPATPQFFDPTTEYLVTAGRLPHWEQAGVVAFITFRTWDSMPRPVLEQWLAERKAWLTAHGIDPDQPNWEAQLAQRPPAEQAAFRRHWTSRWDDALDECHGSCPLRDLTNAKLVADSLRHFDGDRYTMFDFVVMPNHAHLLVSFPEEGVIREQCESWKHFTAVRLNKRLQRAGRFWEEESFDHLVRTDEQYSYLRDYVATNPARANLPLGSFVHYSRPLSPTARVCTPLAPRADTDTQQRTTFTYPGSTARGASGVHTGANS